MHAFQGRFSMCSSDVRPVLLCKGMLSSMSHLTNVIFRFQGPKGVRYRQDRPYQANTASHQGNSEHPLAVICLRDLSVVSSSFYRLRCRGMTEEFPSLDRLT